MNLYRNAEFCIGMRFHSIVLQTYLNGKNYILDYTHPTKGKIVGVLSELGIIESYKERYLSLLIDSQRSLNFLNAMETFVVSDIFISKQQNLYIEKICTYNGTYLCQGEFSGTFDEGSIVWI